MERCSILGCLTVGDLWRKQAEAGDEDAILTMDLIARHRELKQRGLLDCVLCGEYLTDCQCWPDNVLRYEVDDARPGIQISPCNHYGCA